MASRCCEESGVQGNAGTVGAMTLDELCAGLNPAQTQAVRTLSGPLLVIAGPGSGKTRVLTHRIAALVHTGVPANAVLALAFTNKAADEMRDRVSHLLEEDAAKQVWVSTFHSFCLRVLRRYSAQAGLPKNFTVLDQSDSQRVIKSICAELGHGPDDAKVFSSKISFAKNRLETPGDLIERGGTWPVVAEVFEKYRTALRNLGAVDFDDILNMTLELMQSDDHVLQALRQRFAYIMVDEWQDVNACQYQMVSLLARQHRQLCVVGDQQQAIYGWRGSTPEVLGQFSSDFAELDTVILGENYRSTPQIVEVAQAIIDASTSRFAATLTTSNAAGAVVRCVETEDGQAEAAQVVREIAAAKGTRAVLMRTNAQTRPFEAELTRAKVPYQLVGTVRFYDRAEVRDALAYLRIVVNPRDAVALQRAAGCPKRGLGDVGLSAFIAAAERRNVAVGDALGNEAVLEDCPNRARKPLRELAAVRAEIEAASATGVAEAIRTVLRCGVGKHYSGDPERVENLDELLSAAELFDKQGASTLVGVDIADVVGVDRLAAFLESVTLASSSDGDSTTSVSLITAHASKGREFDHVWVVGVEDGLYPHKLSAGPSGMEEERRLFFVAVSRARSGLTITHRQRRFLHGDWSNAEPSPFLADLPDTVRRITRPRASASRFEVRATKPSASSWGGTTASSVLRGVNKVAPRPPSGPRLSSEQRVVGCVVTHPVFGQGTITKITGAEAEIAFEGRKRILDLTFAPLEAA